MRVALRIEVTSLRGLRDGVPNLLRLLRQYKIRASFFFPLGRDLSGRCVARAWRKRRESGWQGLVYGTALPAPRFDALSRRLAGEAAQEGHEIGLVGHSPCRLADRLARASDDWVAARLAELEAARGETPFDTPRGLALPDWQLHPLVLSACARGGIRYLSATRGRFPYFPVLLGQRAGVPEVPTTLPSLPEMLCRPGVDADNVHEFLYADSRHLRPAGHVYAASADREGLDWLPVMEKLLVMWSGQGGAVRPIADLLDELDMASLSHHRVGWDRVDGNPRHLATQSIEVPA
jgi:peptidoglycan/xylan/chitin deacetylase (PgdA/CDA1 family)